MTTITIQKGQTLSGIAQQYKTTIKDLMAANPQIKDPNLIYAGTTLKIPTTTVTTAATPAATPAAPTPIQTTLTPQQTQYFQQQISGIQESIKKLTPQVQALVEPKTTTQIQAGQVSAPTLPTPTAPVVQDQFTQSMLANLEAQRKVVETAYQTQLDNARKAAEAAQAKIDELTRQYRDTLEQARPLMEPFREEKERAERERLKVEENYFANQQLTNELETLLTDIQASLQREKEITGLAAIREPRIAKTKEDAMARVGVIEAVMAARNNQINVANNLIDRTVKAIAADRQDKLNYYQTLLNFYDKQRTEEGQKLITLDKEQKSWIAAQINLLENDLKTSQENAEYIKKLLQDPATALLAAEAGININMTPQQVNQALADAAYQRDRRAKIEAMAKDEKVLISEVEARMKPQNEVFIIPDARGVNMYFWKKETVAKSPVSATGANYNTRLNAEIAALYAGRYGVEGAREKVINILQNEFPNIDVAKDVYNRVPDNWEKLKTKIIGKQTLGGLEAEVGGWDLED